MAQQVLMGLFRKDADTATVSPRIGTTCGSLTHPHHAPGASDRPSEVAGRIYSIYPIPVRTCHQRFPALEEVDILEM
jgi:hypothetical protein